MRHKKELMEYLKQTILLERRIYELDRLLDAMQNQIHLLLEPHTIHQPLLKKYKLQLWPYPIFFLLSFTTLLWIAGNISSVFLLSTGISVGMTAIMNGFYAIFTIFQRQQSQKEYTQKKYLANELYFFQLAKANIIENQHRTLTAKRLETAALLEKLYCTNTLLPRYRSLIPLLSLYEYLDSGLCNSLTGPDGAYLRYEVQRKHRNRIDSLKNIPAEPDSLKHEQYSLYAIVCTTQSIVNALSWDMNKISSGINAFEKSASLAAYDVKLAAEDEVLSSYMKHHL